MLSYMSVLLLPVLIGVFLFQQIEAMLVANSNRTNMGLLEQVKLVAENRFNEIDKMTLQIALNPKVQWALSHGEDDFASRQFDFVDIMKELQNIRSISNFVGEVFLYFKNTETVLTTTGKADAPTFFEKMLQYQGKSVDWAIREVFAGVRHQSYFPDSFTTGLSGSDPMFTYVESLPWGEKTNAKGYLAVLIKEREFDRLIQSIQATNQGEIYIVDAARQVIVSTAEKTGRSEEWLAQLDGDAGYRQFQQDGEAKMVSYTSGNNGWKYISVVPKRLLLEQVYRLKDRAALLLLLILLAGALVSYYLAMRNYNPIRDVVRTIRTRGDRADGEQTNELDYIKMSVIRSFEENHRLSRTLSEQRPVLRANFLLRLIKGHVEAEALRDDSFAFMGIAFPHDHFVIMIVHVNDGKEFMTGDTEKEWALVRFVLANLSADLLWTAGYVVELDRNRLAVLINCAEPGESTERQRNALAEQVRQVAVTRFKLDITIGVSAVHRGVDAIGTCYREAHLALEYHMLYGPNVIIYYEETAEQQPYYYHYPLETEAQLINYARVGDYGNAESLLDQIYDVNITSGGITPEMGKCLFYELLGTYVKVLKGLGAGDKERLESAAEPMKELAGSATAEQMLAIVKRLFGDLCHEANKEKKEHGEQLYARIARYIDKHYAENSLNLTAMADYFQLTPQYLSSFFKKHSNENITDYIARVRIREAKRLLADRTLTMADIALRIGYANDVGFVRFFKKYEGITPGKYRDMLASSAQE